MKRSISLLLIVAAALLGFTYFAVKNSKTRGFEDATVVSLVLTDAYEDKALNESARQAAKQLGEDYNISMNVIECTGNGFGQYIEKAAGASDMVIAVGWEFYEIEEISKQHEETLFVWIDNEAKDISECENLMCVSYAQDEMGFMAGYIAAKSSANGTVGISLAESNSGMNDYRNGFEQGAAYADENIKVICDYINTYTNNEKAKSGIEKLQFAGADVVFGVTGDTVQGLLEGARENGVRVIGSICDRKLEYPEYDDLIICSLIKDTGSTIYNIVKLYMEYNVFDGGNNVKYGTVSEYIGIASGDESSTQYIDADLAEELENVMKGLKNGNIHVQETEQNVSDLTENSAPAA